MNTLNFLDANVWLALLWGRHIHSERARDWLEKLPEEKFFFCRFTQLTVLRPLTSAAVLGGDVRKCRRTTPNASEVIAKVVALKAVLRLDGLRRGGCATDIEPVFDSARTF